MPSQKYTEERPDHIFDNANLSESTDKIKSLGIVTRGGISLQQRRLSKSIHRSSQSLIDVDRKAKNFAKERKIEEEKRPKLKPRQRTESRLSRARVSAERVRTPKEDKDDALSYLTLIQNVQRKRKFAEISNQLKQKAEQETPCESLSRSDWNLNKSKPFGSIFEKKPIMGPSRDRLNTETESLSTVTNFEYDLSIKSNFSSKRMKTWDEEKDSELCTVIDLDKARKLKFEGMSGCKLQK